MDRSVAVIGAGAIGTVFAAESRRAGLAPVVCARSPVDRLVLEQDGVTTELDVPVRTDPALVSAARWVLVTTKAQDTATIAPWLDRLCGRETAVMVLQNGVGHRERVEPLAGAATVVPALLYIIAERVAPGRVVHRRGKRVVLPAGPAARAFAELMAGSTLEIVEEADFVTAAWGKLLRNVAANPITALTARRLDVMREAEVRRLAVTLLDEAVAVGVAEGARLGADDIRATLEALESFTAQDGTSMLYDRLAGRSLEHEEISGVVTRLGRRHGVATPANQAMYALLGAL